MSQQKQEKFTIVTTPEKLLQQKSLVHIEGKLTSAQLEAIAGGPIVRTGRGGSNPT